MPTTLDGTMLVEKVCPEHWTIVGNMMLGTLKTCCKKDAPSSGATVEKHVPITLGTVWGKTMSRTLLTHLKIGRNIGVNIEVFTPGSLDKCLKNDAYLIVNMLDK